MTHPEAVHENGCPLCPVIGSKPDQADQVYRFLSLHFSILIAEVTSHNHDLIRVEPIALRGWLRHVKIDQRHIDHIPPDRQHGIMVTLPNGLGQPLIDGNHRAARALRDGTHFFAAVLNERETLRLLRLTMGRADAKRQWKLLNASGL